MLIQFIYISIESRANNLNERESISQVFNPGYSLQDRDDLAEKYFALGAR